MSGGKSAGIQAPVTFIIFRCNYTYKSGNPVLRGEVPTVSAVEEG